MLDLVERLLKIIENLTDYSEIRYENVNSNRFIIKNGVLEATDISKTFGISIRFLKRGFLGAVYSNDLNFAKLKDLVEKNIRKVSTPTKSVEFSKEKVHTDSFEVKQKININDLSQEEKINSVLEIEKELVKMNLAMRYFELYDETKEKTYVNSEGSKITSLIPRISFEYVLTLIKNNKSEQRVFQYGGTGGWEIFNNWKLSENLVEEAKMLEKLSSAKKLTKGKYDVILSPELVGIASHESCGHPYDQGAGPRMGPARHQCVRAQPRLHPHRDDRRRSAGCGRPQADGMVAAASDRPGRGPGGGAAVAG